MAGCNQRLCLDESISYRSSALGRRDVHAVCNRRAKVGAGVDPREAGPDTEQAPGVSGVAVGIPARRVDDSHRVLKPVPAVKRGKKDEAAVGNDMDVAWKLVVAVLRRYQA